MDKEYIERQAAMPDGLCVGVSCQECPFLDHPIKGGCKIARFIDAIPAAEVVEVRHGRWEWDRRVEAYRCSSCQRHNADRTDFCPNCGAKLKGEKTMDMDLMDRIDRAVRQMLNNQLVIMGALDDLIMHGGGNQWAKVHPALIALHDGMASTAAILEQSAEPPKEETK